MNKEPKLGFSGFLLLLFVMGATIVATHSQALGIAVFVLILALASHQKAVWRKSQVKP